MYFRNIACLLLLFFATHCTIQKPTASDCATFKAGQFARTRYTTKANHVPKVTWYIDRTDSLEVVTREQPFLDTAVYKITWPRCRYRLEGLSYQSGGRKQEFSTSEDFKIVRVTKDYAVVNSSEWRDTLWKVQAP